MKKIKGIMALAAIAAVLFVAAGCDEETSGKNGVVGTWKITAAVFNPAVDFGLGPITDAYALFFSQPCDQDDLIIFQEDGTYIDDEGAIKCNANDPQQTMGTYTLIGSTLTIYESDTTVLNDFNVDGNTATATMTTEINDSTTANVDFTLSRQ